MSVRPDQEWWGLVDIAQAKLPDMPSTRRGVAVMAERDGWLKEPGKSRRRDARGGGHEYHWTLFPMRARSLLMAQAGVATEPSAPIKREEAWTAYDALPQKAKDEATRRLDVIQRIEALEASGLCKDQAVRDMARQIGKSPRTIWNWFSDIDGVNRTDRLPFLAPRHRLSQRKSRARGVDPEFGFLIKSDYLRPEQPSMAACYDRCARLAKKRGIEVPPRHTVYRWFKREVSELTVILMRKGLDALKAAFPPQVRDKSAMHAMEGVNGDFHRFDVFVRFPGAAGQPEEIIRPQMVAFQDVYSGRLLSWRVDRSANSHAVQLCIGDMIERWGIPEHVLLDNGREFAAKLITGGAQTRFRFKAKEDDVPGLLTSLGCEIHWATPYSGQSKPIERAFRDLCDRVAKHPAFAGAYTGNKPDAKPENYGDRAVPLDEFLTVLAEEIEAHNMRPNRRTEVAFGRSFADAFDESYQASIIRKATAEQRRLWLMGAEGLRPHARTGAISFLGNEYWADWLHQYRGQKLVARFDRAALWEGLHIYSLANEYLGHAECRQKGGFFDIDDARSHARARRAWVSAEREAAKRHKIYTAAELGEALEEIAAPPSNEAAPVASVVQMVPNTAKPRPSSPSAEDMASHEAFVADYEAERAKRTKPAPKSADVDSRDLFIRARELEDLVASGGEVTKDQKKWLNSYQNTPDYRGWVALIEDFGEDALTK